MIIGSCFMFDLHHYKINDIIFKDHETPKYVYIIKSGIV